MDGRSEQDSAYRYGFNGKELDGDGGFYLGSIFSFFLWGSPGFVPFVSFSFFRNFHIPLETFVIGMPGNLHDRFGWNPFFQEESRKGFPPSVGADDFIFGQI